MKYIVIEIQKTVEGSISNIVTSYSSKEEAESHYHTILASAAISSLPSHGAVIIDEYCVPIAWQAYTHNVTPA